MIYAFAFAVLIIAGIFFWTRPAVTKNRAEKAKAQADKIEARTGVKVERQRQRTERLKLRRNRRGWFRRRKSNYPEIPDSSKVSEEL